MSSAAGIVKRIVSVIMHLLLTDPRSKMFPFMDTPLATAGMILVYLSWVLIIGPIYMRDRKPMNIKSTLIYYNAFQVILSSYMFYEVSHK